MKQIIVLCGIFILLGALILQIPLEMINYDRRHAIMYYVNNAKEMAKQEGFYTDEILNELRKNIQEKMSLNSPDEIIIHESTTVTPKYRLNEFDEREMIYIKVMVPFHNIVAAPGLYGIDLDENRYFVVEETTASERLGDF